MRYGAHDVSSPAFASNASALPLRNVAGYVLERRLGRGSMGEVWLGRHLVTGRQAAVKLLPARTAQRGRELFDIERKAAARLDHPNIVPLYEHGDDYLIAAYVRGMDLRQRLRTPLALPETLRIVRALGLALAHAHARGVIHRDVKPSNVLLEGDEHVYLADFGVAALLDELCTLENMSAGTRGYMAPEQLAGRAEKASDQFGLGRTFLAMLVGEAALERSSTLPSNTRFSPKLHAFLERCLAERASDRFLSMEELVSALDLLSQGASAESPPVSRAPMLRASTGFGWSRAALEVSEHGADLTETKHSVRTMQGQGALSFETMQALLEVSGSTDLSFSLYGNHTHLGPLNEPDAFARVEEVVVLMHGLLCDRRYFKRLALELCRRHSARIVITPDLHGQGGSPYPAQGPTPEQASPRAAATLVQLLLTNLSLTCLPTVLFGHSFSAGGLLQTRDEELPPDMQRVVLTPVFPHLMPSYRWTLRFTKILSRLSSVSTGVRLYVAREVIRRSTHATGGRLSDDLIEMLAVTLSKTPAHVISRHIDGLCAARPADGALGRCVVVCVPDDPSLPEALAHKALAQMNIPEDRLFMLASGGHFPFGEQADHPEWTARNVHDLCAIIDEAFELPAVAPSDPTLEQANVLGSPLYESGPKRKEMGTSGPRLR